MIGMVVIFISTVHPDDHAVYLYYTSHILHNNNKKRARWPSGRASDSESRGLGFDPHKGHRVVTLSKTRYWLKHRKRWIRPDMTENC